MLTSQSTSMGPETVRALRGAQTRVAFARRLGVTPNTIYRWELPDSAAEARRPRGADLHKLRQLATDDNPAIAVQPSPVIHDVRVGISAWTDDELARVLPAIERVLRGDSRKGHGELLGLFTRGRGLTGNARALACFGIALFELLQRADARSALLAIAPALADAESGLLEQDVTAKVFAVVALAHAEAEASLFDLGRVPRSADQCGFGTSVPWTADLSAVRKHQHLRSAFRHAAPAATREKTAGNRK